MFQIRKAGDRGHLNHGWLDTYHTFSFGDYYDPAQMGFRVLRVMNEDWVQPGMGFGTHGHRDMEIVTLVLEGQLEHKDSMGNGEVLHPGEFQYMSAGRGIRHSEFNPSSDEAVHLYQIWLLPAKKGLEPAYCQRTFPTSEKQGRLRQVASPDGADGSIVIQQDARIYLANLETTDTLEHALSPSRYAWLQVLRGTVQFNSHELQPGDGVAVSDESQLTIGPAGAASAEVLLFDLP